MTFLIDYGREYFKDDGPGIPYCRLYVSVIAHFLCQLVLTAVTARSLERVRAGNPLVLSNAKTLRTTLNVCLCTSYLFLVLFPHFVICKTFLWVEIMLSCHQICKTEKKEVPKNFKTRKSNELMIKLSR